MTLYSNQRNKVPVYRPLTYLIPQNGKLKPKKPNSDIERKLTQTEEKLLQRLNCCF